MTEPATFTASNLKRFSDRMEGAEVDEKYPAIAFAMKQDSMLAQALASDLEMMCTSLKSVIIREIRDRNV